jgi:hypothetical protein
MDYLAVAQFYYRKGAYQPFLWRVLVFSLVVSAFLFSPFQRFLNLPEGSALLLAYILVELYAILVGYILQPNALKASGEILYLSASAATPGRVVLGRYTGFFGLVLSFWLIQTVLHLVVDFATTRGANMLGLLTEHLRILPSAAFFMVSTALLTANVRIPFRSFFALLTYLISYLPTISTLRSALPPDFYQWYPGAQRLLWLRGTDLPYPTIYYAPYFFALVLIMVHYFWERSRAP